MRVLVVGGSGLVGSYLVRAFQKAGNTVFATWARNKPKDSMQADWIQYDVHTDTLDIAPLKLDALVLCAAKPNVNACETEQNDSMLLNRSLPIMCANVAAAERIHYTFISTGYVYPSGRFTELDTPHRCGKPLNQYGVDKFMAEQAVMCAHPSSLIIRTVGVYGYDPGVKCFGARLVKVLSSGQQFIYDPRGVSNWTPADLLALETVSLASSYEMGVFHLAGEQICDRGEFAHTVVNAHDLDADLLVERAVSGEQSSVKRPSPCVLKSVRIGGWPLYGEALQDLGRHKEEGE